MKKLFFVSSLLTFSLSSFAADLTINAAEFGIGKFHRKDNQVHKYEKNNAWSVFILPEGVSTKEAYVMKTSADTYTIFFTSLEELLTKMVELSQSTGKKIDVLNLNAHGLPGGMWFPKDKSTRDSFECASWRDAASNSDDDNYNQYYSAVTKEDIDQMNQLSMTSRIPSYNCLVGLNEWTAMVTKIPSIRKSFTTEAQVHMHSCVVGKGTLGTAYTLGLAKLLFPVAEKQQVQTSIKFGLGDWSMPEGMGFWDYENDEQLKRDEDMYPVHRRDSEIMQKGDIRVAEAVLGSMKTGLIKNVDYMLVTPDSRPMTISAPTTSSSMKRASVLPPASIRVPGTSIRLQLK